MSTPDRQRYILGALRTAFDYTLLVLYGGAALGTLMMVLGARAHGTPDDGWLTLRLSYYVVTSYYWRSMLAGGLLFAVGNGLQRLRTPTMIVGLIGGVVSTVLSVAVIYTPGQSPAVPMQFIFAFGYLPIFLPQIFALLFGLFALPRSAKGTATDFSTRHFVALVPLLLAVL